MVIMNVKQDGNVDNLLNLRYHFCDNICCILNLVTLKVAVLIFSRS